MWKLEDCAAQTCSVVPLEKIKVQRFVQIDMSMSAEEATGYDMCLVVITF